MNKRLIFIVLAMVVGNISTEIKKLSKPKKAIAGKKINKNINLDTVLEVGTGNFRIATVNILDIMRRSKEGELIGAKLEKQRANLTDDIKRDDQKFAQEMKNFNNRSIAMNDEAREKEESRLMKMRRDLEAKVKNSEDELKHAMQRASDRLTKKVTEEVARIAEINNIDLVIDKASGRVLYASDKTSVTNKIVAGLNHTYQRNLAQAGKTKPVATRLAANSPISSKEKTV